MDPKAYSKDYVERAHSGEPLEVVYLAGPIDHTDLDPDLRHDLLEPYLDRSVLIFCPYCAQRNEKSSPLPALTRNLTILQSSESMIAVWDGPVEQPSFGTPFELGVYGLAHPDRTVVVGSMGDGLIANAIRAAGVREVGTLSEAVELLWP